MKRIASGPGDDPAVELAREPEPVSRPEVEQPLLTDPSPRPKPAETAFPEQNRARRRTHEALHSRVRSATEDECDSARQRASAIPFGALP